jgi:hypothetical protein
MADCPFAPGELVSHPIFGFGVVEEVRTDACVVRFGQGKPKAILPSYLQRQSPPALSAGGTRLFDAYLFIDWSASNAPSVGANSIWYCLLEPGRRELVRNARTRHLAFQEIRGHLLDLVEARLRVLVGFDFPYGYPVGTTRRLGFLEGEPWKLIWDELRELVEDHPDNRNNRFEVAAELNGAMTTGPAPFWGCPAHETGPWLQAKKPKPWPGEIPEFRATERALQGPKSPWQLLGAGSAGSQSLVGIPWLAALRDDDALSSCSQVWPFETGPGPFSGPEAGQPFVLHAEVYPSLVPPSPLETIKDAGQVRALAEHIARLDDEEHLAGLFDLTPLGEEEKEAVVREEGWILGVQPEAAPE